MNGFDSDEVEIVERPLKECPLEKVMVYADRAEVSRVITMKVQPNEAYEVRLLKLPDSVDENLVRIEGKGVGTISEVTIQQRNVSGSSDYADEKMKNLRSELEELSEKKERISEKIESATQQRDFVNKFGNNFGSLATGNESASKWSLMDGMLALKDYLSFYNGYLEEYNDTVRALSKERDQLEGRIEAIRTEINKESDRCRDVVVHLNTADDCGRGDVQLVVRYLVRRASWQPKYDVRVNGNDQKMQIQYFGLIEQNSGEDWNDAALFLSTAQPSLGGTVPEQTTEMVNFQPKKRAHEEFSSDFSKRKRRHSPSYEPSYATTDIAYASSDDDYGGSYSPPPPPPPMAYNVSSVADSVMHAVFSIQKKTSIPSDGQEHRVTIGIMTLDVEMEHQCVPKLDAHAYITAKVTNSSEYPMLAGPSSMFLDNNFVCQSWIQPVSSNEQFTCSLGVDPAVRVNYKPVEKVSSEKGMWNKSNCISCSQVTDVHNGHVHPIRLLLIDYLPRSGHEKIKVSLVEPSVVSGVAKLNDKHNVEFNVEMKGNSKRQFQVKYQVDFPAGQDLIFSSSG